MVTRFELDTKVDILGSEWRICVTTEKEEPRLASCDGFTDKTSRFIAVDDVPAESTLDQPIEFIRKVIRHEIIHAFMFESGLAENWKHDDFGQEELTIDWFAIQFHKIQEAINQVYEKLREVKT